MAENAEHSVCGRCGYIVTGLTTFVCPECGSDLRNVGIIRPTRLRLGGGWRLAIKLLLGVAISFLLALALAFAAAGLLLPTIATTDVHTEITPNCSLAEVYTISGQQKVYHLGGADWTQITRAGITIQIQSRSGQATVQLDPQTGKYTGSDAKGHAIAALPTFNEEAAQAALEAANVPKSAPGAQPDAALISRYARDTQTKLAQLSPISLNSRTEMKTPSSGNAGAASQSHSVTWNGNDTMSMGFFLLTWCLLAATASWLIVRRQPRAAALLPQTPASDADSPSVAPHTPAVRTLTVLFSDMKDYTARAAGESSQGVIELVRRHRDIAQPIIRRHGGRLVKTMGDALLVTFDSATRAVRAGLDIQQAIQQHNGSAFTERERLQVRVAISTGEVVIDTGDVFGDTVNLTSRVQQLAGPGEVLFTESTHATIKRSEIPCEPAGEFELKGVPGQVRLYRALNTIPAAASPSPG